MKLLRSRSISFIHSDETESAALLEVVNVPWGSVSENCVKPLAVCLQK